MAEPTTAAGRAVVAWCYSDARPLEEFLDDDDWDDLPGAVLAIEAEARAQGAAQERERLAAAYVGEPGPLGLLAELGLLDDGPGPGRAPR